MIEEHCHLSTTMHPTIAPRQQPTPLDGSHRKRIYAWADSSIECLDIIRRRTQRRDMKGSRIESEEVLG